MLFVGRQPDSYWLMVFVVFSPYLPLRYVKMLDRIHVFYKKSLPLAFFKNFRD